MATFESPEVTVNKTAENFFNKIGDLNNLKDIMPSEIEDFKSTSTDCSFKMKGLPKLSLRITEQKRFSKISLTAVDSQIPFSLDCFITEKGEQCQVKLEINAELNMMMRIMVEKTLTQFLDIIAKKIQNL